MKIIIIIGIVVILIVAGLGVWAIKDFLFQIKDK